VDGCGRVRLCERWKDFQYFLYQRAPKLELLSLRATSESRFRGLVISTMGVLPEASMKIELNRGRRSGRRKTRRNSRLRLGGRNIVYYTVILLHG